MANQLTTNPLVIDTPGAAVLLGTQLRASRFEFTSYQTITDTVVVKNKTGQIVWVARGKADFSPITVERSDYLNGLVVSTLDSGKLLVYYN